jgi:hypothetical protein
MSYDQFTKRTNLAVTPCIIIYFRMQNTLQCSCDIGKCCYHFPSPMAIIYVLNYKRWRGSRLAGHTRSGRFMAVVRETGGNCTIHNPTRPANGAQIFCCCCVFIISGFKHEFRRVKVCQTNSKYFWTPPNNPGILLDRKVQRVFIKNKEKFMPYRMNIYLCA